MQIKLKIKKKERKRRPKYHGIGFVLIHNSSHFSTAMPLLPRSIIPHNSAHWTMKIDLQVIAVEIIATERDRVAVVLYKDETFLRLY